MNKQLNTKKTTKQFEKELQATHGSNFILSSAYAGANTNVKVKCIICGNESEHTPSTLIRRGRKFNCKLCDFKQRLLAVAGIEYNYSHGFKNFVTPVTVVHLPCGSEMTRLPTDFTRKNRPPSCDSCRIEGQTKTTEWFTQQVAQVSNDDYVVEGKYISAKTKVRMLHKTCGNRWEYSPDNFIRRGSRCPYCANNAKLDTAQFREKLQKTYGSEFIVTGVYINAKTPIAVKHNYCGQTRYRTPDALINYGGCPVCNSSSGEILVRNALNSLKVHFEEQKTFENCKVKNKLRFDFYVPSVNLCIEYNGIQHYEIVPYFHGKDADIANSNFEYQLERDAVKKAFCQENNLKLLSIPYEVTQLPDIVSLVKNAVLNIVEESKAENPTPKGGVMI